MSIVCVCVCVYVHVSAANLVYYWTHQPNILLPIYDCVSKDLLWLWLFTAFEKPILLTALSFFFFVYSHDC